MKHVRLIGLSILLVIALAFLVGGQFTTAQSGPSITDRVMGAIFNSTDGTIRVAVQTEAVTGNETVGGTLTVTGATALNGGLTMDSTAFTVANTSGNTAIAGTLAVAGVTSFSNYADLYVGVAATQSYSIASAGKANVIMSTYSATEAGTLHLMTDELVSGRVIEIIDAGGNSDPNSITVDTQGAEKINGADTYAIATDYKHVRCVSNGTHWFCY